MKRNYLFAFTSLSILALGSLQAQVVNGNFETIKPNSLVSNWGMNFSIPVSIDLETGQNTSDVILYGACMPSFVFGTSDAHTGGYAMQISNGYNLTQNQVINAKAEIFNDATQDFPGWNAGVPIEAGNQVTMLGFYYKYYPVQNDEQAVAELIVLDEEGTEMGRATANITQATSTYQYLYSPVQFTKSGIPSFMYISFSMQAESTNPGGGTLIVDDVFVNFAALAQNQFESSHFGVYPTLADQEINVVRGQKSPSGLYEFTITNMDGKIIQQTSSELLGQNSVQIDVSTLPKGIYLISANGYTTKFAKK
ncbi:T9SS type A sorting domain-containing protein [Flavobacterium sp. CYK-55]|uniref:T9SS type A sorting domain-containing protein n=1 Tax=Flavobacterium sp. CYK-55 TaxID=2835529 RepID=UPI001BCADB23|nr:T9SS type A sorting domain-containing protein [Flavobacterium sp. CYK-55]MBS7788214.1 T9SS type A sorting domain-containing protein [Flavobacterium sp. CYK-55]